MTDSPRKKRTALVLGVVAFCAYSYFYQAGGWNQNSRFDLVRALVERQTAAIDAYHRNTGDKGCRARNGRRCTRANLRAGDHYYCDKAPGVSLLAAIPYAPIYWLSDSGKPSPGDLAWSSHAVTVFSVALPSAIGVAVLFLLLLHLGVGRYAAVTVTCAYGFGTLAFPYSTLLYGHQLAGALLLIGFALLVWENDRRRDGVGADAGWVRIAGAGVLLGFAVAVEYPAALAIMVISPWFFWQWRRSWRAVLAYCVGGIVGGLAMFGYHWIVFGGPFVLPYEFVLMPERHQGAFMGIGALELDKLWKVTFSAYRGLFFSAPWLLFGLVGLVLWWLRGKRRAEIAMSALIVALFIWLNASVAGWHGGWTLGARYLIPALPFLALMSASVLASAGPGLGLGAGRGRWLRGAVWLVFVALALLSIRNMVAATAVRPEVPQHVKEPFGKFVHPHFAKGNLAVNRQGIDHPAPPRRGGKQAFNLGMKLGLSGKASLLPLALPFILIFGFWVRGRWLGRRRDADSEPQGELGPDAVAGDEWRDE